MSQVESSWKDFLSGYFSIAHIEQNGLQFTLKPSKPMTDAALLILVGRYYTHDTLQFEKTDTGTLVFRQNSDGSRQLLLSWTNSSHVSNGAICIITSEMPN